MLLASETQNSLSVRERVSVDLKSLAQHVLEAPIDIVALLAIYVGGMLLGKAVLTVFPRTELAVLLAYTLIIGLLIAYLWSWKPSLLSRLMPDRISGWARPETLQLLFDPTQPMSWALLVATSAWWAETLEGNEKYFALMFSALAAAIAAGGSIAVRRSLSGSPAMPALALRLRVVMLTACIGLLAALGHGWEVGHTYAAALAMTASLAAICQYGWVRLRQKRALYVNLDRTYNLKPTGFPLWWLCRLGLVELAWPLFLFSEGLVRRDAKEAAKARAMLLARRYAFDSVEREARTYNAQFAPNDVRFSATLAYYEGISLVKMARPKEARQRLDYVIRGASHLRNPYLKLARARASWALGDIDSALEDVEEALTIYRQQQGEDCYIAVEYKVLFLCEKALRQEGVDVDVKTLELAKHVLDGIPDRGFRINPSLYYALANRLLLEAAQAVEDPTDLFLRARTLLAGRVLRSSHPGAQLRLALLQMIGTNRYWEALYRLDWLTHTLVESRFDRRHAYFHLVDEVRRITDRAMREEVMFGSGIVLAQTIPRATGAIERYQLSAAEDKERFREIRHKLFPPGPSWMFDSSFSL